MKQKFISASVLERIREEVDLLAVVRDNVELLARGSEWHGQCPFHAPRRMPPFRVFVNRKLFRCLSCGAEGDAISFVMKSRRCTFPEAIAILLKRLPSIAEPARAVLERAAQLYERTLWQQPFAECAREHLRQRGILPETARAWRLGYAAPGWTNLTDALQREGFSTTELESAGLSVRRPSGNGHYDRFRGRLMIPIRRRGRVIAFGGRLMTPGDEPKYLNSPDTALFHKGETLFGLDEATAALAAGETAIAVEGFFDAIALHQAGVSTAVAVCGTMANETHLAALTAGGAAEVCFAFDGDGPGRLAAARAATVSLGARCRTTILECPEGMDPDELVRSEGPHGFRARVVAAKRASDLVIASEFEKLPTQAAVEEKVAALSRIVSLFDSAALRFTGEQVQRLAGLVGCSSVSLERFLARRRRHG